MLRSLQKFVLSSLLWSVGLAACTAPTDADLLHLRSVGPAVLDPGASLEVEGDSLPLNRTGELALRGQYFAAGRSPVDVDLTLPVRVVSTNLARATLSARSAPVLLRRGTFVGDARLSFATPAGARVTGRLSSVRIDVRGMGPAGLASRAAAEQAALVLAETLGLTLESRDASEGGLRVTQVRAGSNADRAGLATDDVVLRLGHVGLGSVADFRLPPRARDAALEIERRGVRRRISFELDRGPQDPLRRVALAFAAFLACLALMLSPAGRLFDPISRPHAARPRLRHGALSLLSLGALAVSAQLLRTLNVDLLLWVALLAFWGFALARGPGVHRRTAILNFLRRALTVEVALFSVVGASLLSAGASTFNELAARRSILGGGAHLGWANWPLVTDPLLALGALGYLAALVLGSRSELPSWPRQVASIVYRSIGAAFFLVVFGNGAALLSSNSTTLIFIAEAATVAGLVTLALPVAARLRRLLPLIAAGTLALALSPASFRGDLPHGRELAVILLLCVVFLVGAQLLRWRRRPAPHWLVHPFL